MSQKNDPSIKPGLPFSVRVEKETVTVMIRMFCKKHHRAKNLCLSCSALNDYAMLRLDNCKFGVQKPVCSKCPVHCYNQSMREQIRGVMRWSGPRMIWTHPVLALLHQYKKLM